MKLTRESKDILRRMIEKSLEANRKANKGKKTSTAGVVKARKAAIIALIMKAPGNVFDLQRGELEDLASGFDSIITDDFQEGLAAIAAKYPLQGDGYNFENNVEFTGLGFTLEEVPGNAMAKYQKLADAIDLMIINSSTGDLYEMIKAAL